MSESEARSFIAGLALAICALIAALAWGQTALNYVIVAGLLWLTWDRANLHEHAQMRWRRTIRALAALRRRVDSELADLRVIAMSPYPIYDPSPDTDEIPVQPGPTTEPMALLVNPTPAVQARRDAAWDQQRPSPVPRGNEYVERVINIGGTLQTYRIPAKREEAS